jgi:hypothetical protein
MLICGCLSSEGKYDVVALSRSFVALQVRVVRSGARLSTAPWCVDGDGKGGHVSTVIEADVRMLICGCIRAEGKYDMAALSRSLVALQVRVVRSRARLSTAP